MLGDKPVSVTLAVKDLASAKKFYAETLGLKQVDENPGGVPYQSGNDHVFIYASEFAGTNQATAAAWGVGDDIEAVVSQLETKGITFESYDIPGAIKQGAVHVMGDMKSAWFKDPDGNILNLVNKM